MLVDLDGVDRAAMGFCMSGVKVGVKFQHPDVSAVLLNCVGFATSFIVAFPVVKLTNVIV